MKHILCSFLLLCGIITAAEPNSDLSELLHKFTSLTEGRWKINLNGDIIEIKSRQKVLGIAAGASYGPTEKPYTLYFRYKIVSSLSEQERKVRKSKLDALNNEAKQIKHTASKIGRHYEPADVDQWSLVIKVRQAEQKVSDIPEFNYKSIWLSEEYSMHFFIPNLKDKAALQHTKDIHVLYQLFGQTIVTRKAPFNFEEVDLNKALKEIEESKQDD